MMPSVICTLYNRDVNSKEVCFERKKQLFWKSKDLGGIGKLGKFSGRHKVIGAIHWTEISGNFSTKLNGKESCWKLVSKILYDLQRLYQKNRNHIINEINHTAGIQANVSKD